MKSRLQTIFRCTNYLCALIFAIFFCFGHSPVLVAGGLSTWSQETPGGNQVYHESSYPDSWNYILCRNSDTASDFNSRDEVIKIDVWYFYRGYILGTLANSDSRKYFVFGEDKCEMKMFANESEFLAYKEANSIQPKLWIREYNSHHGYLYTDVKCAFCLLPHLIRNLIVLCITIGLLFFGWRLKSRLTYLLLVIWLVTIALRIVMDVFPDSI